MTDATTNALPLRTDTGNNPEVVVSPPVNNNNANRNRPNQSPLINVRDRLFHALFFKTALAYAQLIPKPLRRAFELFILLKAMAAFFVLMHIHVTFMKTPATCLDGIKNDWPRDGVLRVEILLHPSQGREVLTKAYEARDTAIGPQKSEILIPEKDKGGFMKSYDVDPSAIRDLRQGEQAVCYSKPNLDGKNSENKKSHLQYSFRNETFFIARVPKMIEKKIPSKEEQAEAEKISYDEEQYIVEYSLEYGHLRLSAATRQKLKIPVRVVTLDPQTEKCFGDSFTRYLLREFLGYDDVLMASIRAIAEQEDNKGYLRNVVTGEHYRFVSMWWAAWCSYPVAFCAMVLFTLAISMLLRYSHHQIFVFIGKILNGIFEKYF